MNTSVRLSFRAASSCCSRSFSAHSRPALTSALVNTARMVRAPIQYRLQVPIARTFKTFKNKPAAKGQKWKRKSCVKKRFRVTGNGRLKFKRAGTRHKLGNKSPEQKKRLHKKGILTGKWEKHVKQLLKMC